MTTWATQNGDLYLDPNGNIAVWKEDLNILKQQIINELQTFIGEVFTDNRIGTSYYDIIFNDRLPLQEKQIEFERVILQLDGVLGITQFNFELDRSQNLAKYDITISTSYGPIALQDRGVLF